MKELNTIIKNIYNYIVCKDINTIESERKDVAKLHNKQLDNFISIDKVTNKCYSKKKTQKINNTSIF